MVALLLDHGDTRLPSGPCDRGIGTLLLQVEEPFLRYNLFYYVYVLSHFRRAIGELRFREALGALTEKLDLEGNVVLDGPHRAREVIGFCARGKPSEPATRRHREIVANLSLENRDL